ncbi:MAG TPA: FAD-binding oxidoreductase [Microlunatus sp.]
MHELAVEKLRSRIDGAVITAIDDGFDRARRSWNADIDRRPAAVVQCATGQDVVAAIGHGRDHDLEIAVRGGGHSFPGHSSCDGGLVIDLGRLNGVRVDPLTRRARVQGGALLRDLDAATQEHGLAVPAGIVGHTGVGGLTLGGGMGWLTRRGGLTIDHLVGAEVVTADGRVRHASAIEEPDLFWALRGGGGNFGVVTEFEFDLIEVAPMVQFGLFFWGAEQGRDAHAAMRDLVRDLPLSLNAIRLAAYTAPPAPFVPAGFQGLTGTGLVLVGFDDPDAHQEVCERLRTTTPPLFDVVTPMPYVALQQLLDEANGWGFYAYDKGGYFAEISDNVIEVLTTVGPRKGSPMSLASIYPLDGAYSEVPDEATAFSGGRSPRCFMTMIAMTPSQQQLPAERAWVRDLFDALEPHMLDDGAYVNVLPDNDEQHLSRSYGAKYPRLQEIKSRYDPDNVFHGNVNIRPLATTP